MRPIDADKLIAQLEEDVKHIDDAICQMMTYAAINDVKKQPTIDIAERRGKWEKKWHSVFKQEIPCCSECHNFMAFRWDYCPNCGAKMIADKDDTQ